MEPSVLTIIYLIASVTFILGLKMLSHPETARKGNLVAAVGMTLAIFGTIFIYRDPYTDAKLGNYAWIFGGLIIGGIIGVLAARKVKMTAMPEMVSMFNGMGGACAALISIVEFHHFAAQDFTIEIFEGSGEAGTFALPMQNGTLITILLGLIIGSVSFAGSMIAWGKLNGSVKDRVFKGQHIVNMLILLAIIALSIFIVYDISNSFVIDAGSITNTGKDVTLSPFN